MMRFLNLPVAGRRAVIMEDWRRDYENMRDAMIYGDKPTWEELMDAMEQLQMRVRGHFST